MKSWLTELRKESGLRQSEIAKCVGLSRPGYTNIENGERRPSVEVAQRIANVLGFDWTRFFEEEKEVG